MILCSAIAFVLKDVDEPIVMCGERHGDIYAQFHDLGHKMTEVVRHEEGFLIIPGGWFMDRKQAYAHARQCGQLSAVTRHEKREKGEEELYSEDLW